LLREMDSLWVFLAQHGVEPTNNRAERALRFGVLWRKRSLGTASEQGNRWVERILSLKETCRLQARLTSEVLVDAVSSLFEAVLTPPKLKAGASRVERDRYRAFRAHYEEHAKHIRYILVVAPTTAGPHRLLIWEHGRVQQLRHDPQQGYRGTQFSYAPGYSIEFYEAFRIPPPCHTSPERQL
jgi:hypothetical protein